MTTADLISYISLGVSSFSLLLIIYGLSKRRIPALHMKIMISCFALDLLNVVFIEVTRIMGLTKEEGAAGELGAAGEVEGAGGIQEGAVAQSLESLSDGSFNLLDFHVIISALMLLGYVVAIITGKKLHKTGKWRGAHKANAALFIITRLTNYITSFMI